MKKLADIIDGLDDPEDKDDYMYFLYQEIKKDVDACLHFGAVNSKLADETSCLYYNKQRFPDQFFSYKYTKIEQQVLPAILSFGILLEKGLGRAAKNTYEVYINRMKEAYIYGTGTCEYFAIIGAYYLAKRLDVKVSIETLFSKESHTYLRVHTQPEYVFDFWSDLVCKYNDTVSWHEVVPPQYKRNWETRYSTVLSLNSSDLLAMGEMVFNATNEKKGQHLNFLVRNKFNKETQSIQSGAENVLQENCGGTTPQLFKSTPHSTK